MTVISVKDAPFNAAGNYDVVTQMGTDDTAAIQSAIDAAIANGAATLVFPPGTYLTSSYLRVEGARGLKVMGSAFSVVRYPSDDTGLNPDGIAANEAAARSAFLFRYCSDVEISNLIFLGASTTEIKTANLGCGVYLFHCEGVHIRQCVAKQGYALLAQDQERDTTGLAAAMTDTLVASAYVMTLHYAAGGFNPGHVGRRIHITNTADPSNAGTFEIVNVSSSTDLDYQNSTGSNESGSSFRWVIADADRGTRLETCRSDGTRGAVSIASDSVIRDCEFARPLNPDLAGFGDRIDTSSGTRLIDAAGRFVPLHDGKYIVVETTPASGMTPATFAIWQIGYSSATELLLIGSGLPSAGTYRKRWWIPNGDKVGTGAGSGALTFSAGAVTLTSTTAAFTAGDVDRTIRIARAPTDANNGAFRITSYVSSTQVTFANADGVTETTFGGIWSIDEYDQSRDGIEIYGSTHAIYIAGGGRSNILVEGCTFRGIRTTCVKASASDFPIRNVTVRACHAYECAQLFEGGADDTQEHTGLIVEGNTLLDCGFGSAGRGTGLVVSILGARSVAVRNNHFHWTHDAIGTFDGRGFAGNVVVAATGAAGGISQPLEDLLIAGNKLTVDPISTAPGYLTPFALKIARVGIRTKWGTGSTSGASPMTLTTTGTEFGYQDVDRLIRIWGSGIGTRDPAPIESVAGDSVLSFSASQPTTTGTYGIEGGYTSDYGAGFGGGCRIVGNDIHITGTVAIHLENTVGAEVVDNVLSNGFIDLNGDVSPRLERNRVIASNTNAPVIRISSGTSWPIIAGNTITNPYLGAAEGADVSIGDDSGNILDWPLLGRRGRVVPTYAKQEVVIAYGSLHVPGDYIEIFESSSIARFTYNPTSPGGNEFDSFADLISKINSSTAMANYHCEDYGDPFHIDTHHLKLFYNSQLAADGKFFVLNNAINPTALVMLTNDVNYRCYSRGSGSAGPVADKTVVWSQMCGYSGSVQLWADTATAQATLASNGWRALKNVNDAGCCEVVDHGAASGGEAFRWAVV